LKGVIEMSQTPAQELGITGTDFVMFSTSWCGYCKRLKRQLNDSGINFREINIEEQIQYASFVELVNGGNQVVPTLLFADGSSLTNPSVIAIKAKIQSTPA
jgi:mycoredoxin